ncbi:MAG: hypothetical protein ACLRMZ_27745 [Blautia marasmi]
MRTGIPLEEGDNVKIVIPFTADGELKDNTLTVALDFAGDMRHRFRSRTIRKISRRLLRLRGNDKGVSVYGGYTAAGNQGKRAVPR